MSGPTKLCTGPAHAGPTLVPLDEQHWHFHRSGSNAGQPVARCKLCANWAKLVTKDGQHGLVDAGRLRQFARELVDRCDGFEPAERAHGVAASTLRAIVGGESTRVQKRVAARLLLALSEQRKQDRRNGTSARFLAARRRQVMIEERQQRLVGY